MAIKIDLAKCAWQAKYNKCVGGKCNCQPEKTNCCAENCPNGAISREGGVHVDATKCTDCGVCISICPYGAISL